jgi:acyl carrier protein
VHILDRQLNLVPIGIPGELYIGGVGLSRGYVNSPDLTAENFIPDPLNAEPGARLYKTGDRARYRADGNIDFLGRSDQQVKIRGFRVELGEIEAVLTRYPAVQQAVVVASEDIPGENRLIAYIVPTAEEVLSASELRNFLKSEIPEYMIPWTFVVLDAIPLTPNRKVDRSALPAPEPSRPELKNPFIEPRTTVEEVLAKIWAEVLNLQQVGIHDNFFDLGGHSLRATQVVSRACKAFHVELPLRTFFENPTVSDLAVKIGEIQAQTPVDAGDLLRDLEALNEEEAERLISTAESGAAGRVERGRREGSEG